MIVAGGWPLGEGVTVTVEHQHDKLTQERLPLGWAPKVEASSVRQVT